MLAPLFALALRIWPAAAAPTPVPHIALKDGTVYLLKESPRLAGGRIIFTTADGKVYSIAESEVGSIGFEPTPTPAPRVTYSAQDSRALGAIARQQRERRGLSASVAPRAEAPARAPGQGKRVRPTRTPRPLPSRTPAPAAGKGSPG